jgi:hypothetical protein
MITLNSWRVLLVIAGLLGATAACTNSVPRQDTGGAAYDNPQPQTERAGGGGGGGGY